MRAFTTNMRKQTATLAGREIHFKSLPAVRGRDHQVGAALNLTGRNQKGVERCGNDLHQPLLCSDSESLLGVKKERIPVCP